MTSQKWITLALYAFMAGCALLYAEAAPLIGKIFLVLAGIHLLEFFAVWKLLKSAPGHMAGHFLQTLLYGFLHWLPLKKGAPATGEES